MHQLQRLVRQYELENRTSLPELERLLSSVRERRVRAGQVIFREGEACPYIYVLRAGLIKQYSVSKAGKQWIRSFKKEGDVFGCSKAFHNGEISEFSCSALEYSVIEEIRWGFIQDLSALHFEWGKVIGYVLNRFLLSRAKRADELLMLNPEELYISFINNNKGLLKRISQKELASYLGITPVGLNRIVKRNAERRQEESEPTP